MTLLKQTILIISNEPWDGVWYSKHNYAYELSKKNTVYFINPPKKWSILNLINFKIIKKQYSNSLIQLTYGNALPSSIPFLSKINNYIISRRLKNWLILNEKINDFIFWSFDPVRLYNPKLLAPKISVFHCVDLYNFHYLGEKIICKNSDLLFSTSQAFIEMYNEFKLPKHIVPHGISTEEFVLDYQELESIKNELKSKKIESGHYGLFTGVIDVRIDYDFIEDVIKTFSNITFVFVGPINIPKGNSSAERIFKNNAYKNVSCLGEKPFKQLKYYVSLSHFCFSFMDMNNKRNTIHHHKTLGYLAQGKPVFSSSFTEYSNRNMLMYMSNSKKEIINLITEFIKNGEEKEKEVLRTNYAKKFTFENILNSASKILEEYSTNNFTNK
jgi:hypothetical protein